MIFKANSIKHNNLGFTIVELLIVIVIIGILAAITLVSYAGISSKANESAIKAELTNASKKLSLYHTEHDTYPTNIDLGTGCPTAPMPDTLNCVKSSTGTEVTYSGSSNGYILKFKKNNLTYQITEDSSPTIVSAISCPTGYIIVPGSATYGTSDFCVMKYEAKNDGSGNAVSTMTGIPWDNISQADASTASSGACAGCHLITESEWMTIAQNVLSVSDNWSGGTVGSGYIYSGHNDGDPFGLQQASSDSDGYFGTGNSASEVEIRPPAGVPYPPGKAERRTLKLTNGEVIWDLAGNAGERTASTFNGISLTIHGGSYGFETEWSSVTGHNLITPDPSPSATGIVGAGSWTSANGIGLLLDGNDESSEEALTFMRGGDLNWCGGTYAGVLGVNITGTYGASLVGFRVAR